jgi:serine/threonine protein kinase
VLLSSFSHECLFNASSPQLSVIQGIHKAGITHRDLKPDNILFGEDGHFIVADFGVAHAFDSDDFMEDEFPLLSPWRTLNF